MVMGTLMYVNAVNLVSFISSNRKHSSMACVQQSVVTTYEAPVNLASLFSNRSTDPVINFLCPLLILFHRHVIYTTLAPVVFATTESKHAFIYECSCGKFYACVFVCCLERPETPHLYD